MSYYMGTVKREFFDAHDEMSYSVSKKPMYIEMDDYSSVKDFSFEAEVERQNSIVDKVELLMLEIYGRDQTKWTRRTSEHSPGDRVSIVDISKVFKEDIVGEEIQSY